jgi:hypothetical protein
LRVGGEINVSTQTYLAKICAATENEAKVGLYMFIHRQYVNTAGMESGPAGLLAAAVTNRVFGEKPTGETATKFAAENTQLIDVHARKLSSDDALCSRLSGAAYNASYGRYIASGGSRGMFSNKFLTYIRTLSRLHDKDYDGTRQKTAAEINQLDKNILAPIEAMRSLGIFRPLADNPDERSFYNAIHQFALESGALKK